MSEVDVMIVYRDVIPVAGEAVPEGCERKSPNNTHWYAYPSCMTVWSEGAVLFYNCGGSFRCPSDLVTSDWLNTLSLD